MENYNLYRILQKCHKLASYHLDDPGELGDLGNELVALIQLHYPDVMKEAVEPHESRAIPALLPSRGTVALPNMHMRM